MGEERKERDEGIIPSLTSNRTPNKSEPKNLMILKIIKEILEEVSQNGRVVSSKPERRKINCSRAHIPT